MSKKYDDMIYLERPVSKRHAPMSRIERAAQFSPFAALTGYDAAIRETQRQTEEKITLGEDCAALLDQKIQYLQQHAKEHLKVKVTYFVADSKKQGGTYLEQEGIFKRVDLDRKALIFTNQTEILLKDMIALDFLEKTDPAFS